MTYCQQCRLPAEVALWRFPGVGLRRLDAGCAARLQAMGAALQLVGPNDPRVALELDLAVERRHVGVRAVA